MEEYDRDQSEFNMAVSYLNRINYIIYQCNEAANNLDMFKWFHGLLNLHREVSTKMKKEDFEKGKDFINKIEPLISQVTALKKNPNGFSKDLYFNMHEFEIFLRLIIKDSGLEMKFRADPRFALGRRN